MSVPRKCFISPTQHQPRARSFAARVREVCRSNALRSRIAKKREASPKKRRASHFVETCSHAKRRASHFVETCSHAKRRASHFVETCSRAKRQASPFVERRSHAKRQASPFVERRSRKKPEASRFVETRSHAKGQAWRFFDLRSRKKREASRFFEPHCGKKGDALRGACTALPEKRDNSYYRRLAWASARAKDVIDAKPQHGGFASHLTDSNARHPRFVPFATLFLPYFPFPPSHFDIPALDLDRAIQFYAAVLARPIQKEEFGGTPREFGDGLVTFSIFAATDGSDEYCSLVCDHRRPTLASLPGG